jgi:hypothetical protein
MPHRSSAKPTIQTDDTLIDHDGKRYIVDATVHDDEHDSYFILRPEGSPRNTNAFRYLTFDEFDTQHWSHLPREEVSSMPKQASEASSIGRLAPTPPRMTRDAWLKRSKTAVTFTKPELEQLARLVSAGHVLLRNEPSVSPKLRAAMSRLGINSKGL